METPETRYAKSGDVNVAYQVTGEGPFDVVFIPPFTSHVELAWTVPTLSSFYARLGAFCRVIRLDKRGTGMSDPVVGAPSLEVRMDDVRAVMEAAGCERAALMGISEGGPMSILFAATYPDRVWALILAGTYARSRWAPDYPWGIRDAPADEPEPPWPEAALWVATNMAPTATEEELGALADYIRMSSSPGAAAALAQMNLEIDVRHVLPAISVPTLVLNRAAERPMFVHGARYLAEHIAGAKHVELPGVDHAIVAGDQETPLREIKQFLTATWEASGSEELEPDRVLATVLFTDIVGSTARAAELGDSAWRRLLEQHHEAIRGELDRFRGSEIDTAGDGFFASFDGPARAIRCARAIQDAVEEIGVEIRAGLHTGECELLDRKVTGIAVAIGARVAAQAGPGEVLVSQTVKDLVAGSGIEFADRGVAELKGVPGEWRLFAVQTA